MRADWQSDQLSTLGTLRDNRKRPARKPAAGHPYQRHSGQIAANQAARTQSLRATDSRYLGRRSFRQGTAVHEWLLAPVPGQSRLAVVETGGTRQVGKTHSTFGAVPG